MAFFGTTAYKVHEHEERLTKIEEFLQKKDKKFKESLTLNQKLLALAELGVINDLLRVNDNKKMVSRLLSLLLDVSEQNLREELSHILIKKGSNLYTGHNIKIVSELLASCKFLESAENLKNQIDK